MTDKNNTRLWDELGKTDPAHTSGFKRGGGFSGTAIKPIWIVQRMTEMFGPCGSGWGMREPRFEVQNCNREILVFCHVAIWYQEDSKPESSEVWGVGGDKVVVQRRSGPFYDDEAYKKAYTDAVNNALKWIGVGADVHMGRFDDSKYVNDMAQEFTEPKPEPKTKAVARENKEYEWLQNALRSFASTCTAKELVEWGESSDIQEKVKSLPESWRGNFREQFNEELQAAKARGTQKDAA